MAKNDEVEVRLFEDAGLSSWVMAQVSEWRNHYEQNYEKTFKEYYRIWRGIYDPNDKTRASERSKIISPATSQAIESSVAEIEEATFGRGRFFDIRDDIEIPNPPENMTEEQAAMLQAEMQQKKIAKMKIKYLRDKLTEDFQKQKIRQDIGEVLLNAAVFGTGIAEVVIDLQNEIKPATRPMGGMMAQGTEEEEKTVVKLKAVLPQNFLIQPEATDIESSLGVAIDEDVSPHSIKLMQEAGIYKDVTIETSGTTSTDILEPDPTLVDQPDHVVRLTKYYGLVPRHLLDDFETEGTMSELEEALEETTVVEEGGETVTEVDIELIDLPDPDDSPHYVEACIVIANGSTVLKAIENPYMMQDRPVIAFPWDVVPSRFWGRGVTEKAYHPQKALDTELRARIDALALTNSPMMAMDSTRIPRGSQPEVRPGKILLTNGNPAEVLQPFNFGQVSQITFAQAQALQQMVQQATGAVDSAMPGNLNDTAASTLSMGLSAIIKRQKRTLVNFQQSFLIPFVKMAACRYMQFDPENYPVEDFVFTVTSSLGILQREYEVTQLVQLLQTMPQDNPLYPALIKSIVDNMALSNREELDAMIDQSMQPDPQQQEMAQVSAKAQLEFTQGQTAALVGQANESNSRAKKIEAETIAVPIKLESDRIEALADLTRSEGDLDKDDKLKLKIAETAIKEKKVSVEEAKISAAR
tara:strand:+ start:1163 stop:3253 length:2091 start_codon:yes stop_codon:yes gene_type:complete